MKYVKLTENNDWEGEEWNFFIPLDVNKEGLKLISDKLNENPQKSDCSITLHEEVFDEEEVDGLVKMSKCGYMHEYNKMTGSIKSERFYDLYIDDFLDLIYKGQLKNIGLYIVR